MGFFISSSEDLAWLIYNPLLDFLSFPGFSFFTLSQIYSPILTDSSTYWRITQSVFPSDKRAPWKTYLSIPPICTWLCFLQKIKPPFICPTLIHWPISRGKHCTINRVGFQGFYIYFLFFLNIPLAIFYTAKIHSFLLCLLRQNSFAQIPLCHYSSQHLSDQRWIIEGFCFKHF